jgi:hypothetical protein
METFPDLDVQRVASELRLVERGKQRGSEEQPPSAETALDAVETEIVEQVTAAQKIAHDELENQLTGFRQRLIDLDFEARFSGIKDVAQGGLADLKAEHQMGLDDLHRVRKDHIDADKYVTTFRATHKIKRPSKINSWFRTTLKVMIILLLFAGEWAVNAYYFARGDELGLAGGFIQAMSFSALNVGGSLLIALTALPFLFHRNFFAKLWGLFWLLVFIGGSLLLNLGIAHYREVSADTIVEAGAKVLARLKERPFVLDDFQSWILMALGVLASVIALIDGLSFKDRYPQYQEASDNLRKAEERYVSMRRQSIENLQGVRQQYQDAVTDLRSDLSKRRTEHEAIIAHRQRKLTLFREHQNHLERAANALLRAYRDANIQARKTPAPERFQQPYLLPRIKVQIVKENEWNTDDLKQAIAGAQTDLESVMSTLTQFFDRALESYRELDRLAPEA